ncbi:hypothetical protein [Bilophila sp.]|uniref:hypothetical protein n=1 Tax=Bilophila sp. TaxID=1929485 RepID=UPI0030779583
MAIRIQQYNTGPRRIGFGGIDPGYQQPRIGNVAATAENQLAGTILEAGKELTNIAIKEYVSTETTRVSQALLAMQKELSAERDRYMAENQGQNAIDAGQHFQKFARETAQKYFQEGGFSGRFAEMFNKQAAGTALHFTEQGQAYGRQQKAAWEDSVITGDIEDFQSLAAQNYNNPELIEFNRSALRERIENMRPGMDNRALLSRIDEGAAESIISGYLSHDDIKGARGALNEYRGLLGDKVNAVELQIRNRADALEAKARAEAEQRTREFRAEQSLNIVSMFKDDPLSGVSELLTPEGRKKYGLDAVTAKSTIDMLRAQDSQNKQQQKEFNSRYTDQTINAAYMVLVGDPQKGISPDPAMAFSIIDNSALDAVTKIEAKQKLEAGTFGKTRNPAKVNAMASAIISGQDITDGTITSMMARGEASSSDVSNLKQLKKDMDGPLNGYFKRGKELADTAFARPQFAAGTPEAAIKEDRARAQINSLIREAYKKGGDEGVEKLFNSDTLFNVLQGNMPNLQDQLNNINGIINISPDTNQQLKRKAGESPESWWNRVGVNNE